METNSSETNPAPDLRTRPPTRRLWFHRRYGWVFDEWKDPSEEALAGGRGMFCVLPIAKYVVGVISQSVGFAAESVARAVKSPDQFSSQQLQATLCGQFHKLSHNVQQLNLTLMNLDTDSPIGRRQDTMQPKEDPEN